MDGWDGWHAADLVDGFRARGERPAVAATSGRRLTYAQLAGAVDAETGRYATGTVVALSAANGAGWVRTMLGLTRTGAVVATVSPLGAPREIAEQLRRTRASRLIAAPDVAERLDPVGIDVEVLDADPGTAAPPGPVPLPRPAGAEVMALMTSSGTTGRPKTVQLTHRGIAIASAQLARAWALRDDDVVYDVLPLSHAAGLTAALAVLGTGAELVLAPRFEPVAFLTALARHRATVVMAAPPVLRVLATHPAVDDLDLGALRVVASAGAPLPAELQRACETRLGVTVCNAYGMTETGWIASGSVDDPGRPGTAGRLLPEVTLQVTDPETGAVLAPGEVGELWVRSPVVTPGYLDDPEATAALVTPDGWARTGDLGTCDGTGVVRTVDRLKDLIKYKGHQVSPAELEDLLLARDDVVDAAVVADPDPEAGEVPHAYVVARAWIDPNELLAWIAERVSPHKRIRTVTFVAEIPRLPAGKILRRMLGATPVG